MGINLSAIFTLLTSPPGYLIYHLVVSLGLAVIISLALARRNRSVNGRRALHVLIGCGVLLLIHISLFITTFLSINLPVNNPLVPGMVERLAGSLTIIWVIWVYIEDDKGFILTGLNIFLSLVLCFGAAVSLVILYLQPLIQILDRSILDILWQGGSLLLILIGLVILIARRPHQWGVAALSLIFLGFGYSLQITLFDTNFSLMGPVRLALTLTLPWLLALTQRFPILMKDLESPVPEIKQESNSKPVDTKPELVDLLLKINLKENNTEKFQAAARALSLSVVADICYLVRILPAGNEVELAAGYDLIREIDLPSTTLERDELLHIMDAWADKRVLQLSQAHSDTRDAYTLALSLNYHQIGNMLAYPLNFPNQPTVGGVIFLSPYTSKHWGAETLRLMDEIKYTLTQVLFAPNPLDNLRADLDRKQEQMDKLREASERLSNALSEKESLISTLGSTIKKLKAKYQIEKLESVKQMDALRQEIDKYHSQSNAQRDITSRLEHLTAEIRQLTQERDQLKTDLARANARIKHLETQTGQTGPTRLSMDNQVISLDSIAANVRLQVASLLQQKNLDLEILNPDGRQMIRTDPELLQNVLHGLLKNAIQVSPYESSIKLTQNLSLETGMLIAEVTDFGEGLTQEEQTALFSADHEAIPGIGSIQAIRNAIRAIRVLNGKIWLRSKKNQFTTFRVQLPVRIID